MSLQYSEDENLAVKIFYGWGYDAGDKVSKDVTNFIQELQHAGHRIIDMRMSGGSGGESGDFAAVINVMVIYSHVMGK